MRFYSTLAILSFAGIFAACGDFNFGGGGSSKRSGGEAPARNTSDQNPNAGCTYPASYSPAPQSGSSLLESLIKGMDLNKLLSDPQILAMVDMEKLMQIINEKGGLANLAKDPDLASIIASVIKPQSSPSPSPSMSPSPSPSVSPSPSPMNLLDNASANPNGNSGSQTSNGTNCNNYSN